MLVDHIACTVISYYLYLLYIAEQLVFHLLISTKLKYYIFLCLHAFPQMYLYSIFLQGILLLSFATLTKIYFQTYIQCINHNLKL